MEPFRTQSERVLTGVHRTVNAANLCDVCQRTDQNASNDRCCRPGGPRAALLNVRAV